MLSVYKWIRLQNPSLIFRERNKWAGVVLGFKLQCSCNRFMLAENHHNSNQLSFFQFGNCQKFCSLSILNVGICIHRQIRFKTLDSAALRYNSCLICRTLKSILFVFCHQHKDDYRRYLVIVCMAWNGREQYVCPGTGWRVPFRNNTNLFKRFVLW